MRKSGAGMTRFLNATYSACAAAACGLLFLLFALVLYGIAARAAGAYSGGASDLAGYVMAAATFFALAPTFRAGGHIYVSVIVGKLPPRPRRRASLAAHALMFAAAAALAVYMSRLAYFSFVFGEKSEGADALPLWIPQLPAALGSVVFAAAVLHGAVEVWREKSQNIPPKEQHPAPPK